MERISRVQELAVNLPVEDGELNGDLAVPAMAKGLVVFAHGSGSSRKSPRNRMVAEELNRRGFATLLFDLLTHDEAEDRRNVFDIELLGRRLAKVTHWLARQPTLSGLPIGYFGASTGAAAALMAAAEEKSVRSVVSRGGRPDLAEKILHRVNCPVLLIVGGQDHQVVEFNERAKKRLKNGEMILVPGATHLFEEPGTLNQVTKHAADWFAETLAPPEREKTA